MADIAIRQAGFEDLETILPMWRELFPEDDEGTALREIAVELISPVNFAIFLAEDASGRAQGFLHTSLRHDYVSGCETSPVGYLEAWFVDAEARRTGVGAALVQAGEAWARARGCTEMGSDCLLTNDVSLAAHTAIGYEEDERLIVFRKSL